MNVPPSIGMAVSSGKATMADLSTTLGLEDLHDVLEIAQTDAHNARILDQRRQRQD